MIRFGIVGTGAIASQFAKEGKLIKGMKLSGVVARNYEKTCRFAKEYGIEEAYESVEEMMKSDKIDAVYIATFHPTHYTYTMLALKHGKHVLCEKPSVLSLDELKDVTGLARKKKLLFMEAMTVGFNPIYKNIKEAIRGGEIGELVHVESSFGKVSTKAHKHNEKQAGGALYDIGIYNIFLQTDLLGVPSQLTAFERRNSWGVEGAVSVMSKFENGATASFYATMDSISGNNVKLIGTKGIIEIPDPWTTALKYKLTNAEGKVRNYSITEKRWLGYEIEAFIETLEENKKENDIMKLSKSFDVHSVIDSIKKELGYEYSNIERKVY